MVAIYARVSTANGQTPENQIRALREVAARHGWQVTAEYVDHGISGAKGRDQRPEFDKLCRAIARKEFDLVMAWSVDRLGRSLQDLVSFLSELHAKDVDLYLDRQGIDTTTPAGKAMFQMMGVFAEFERAIIRERIMAGLDTLEYGLWEDIDTTTANGRLIFGIYAAPVNSRIATNGILERRYGASGRR